MERIYKTKYEAMGFVEALIAIMVVGIASVVLMDISVRTMQEVIQNETIDKMTQLAVEGAEMSQEVAKKEIAEGLDLFPNSGDLCYVIASDGAGNYFFRTDIDPNPEIDYFYKADRDEYKESARLEDENYDEFFRVVCMDPFDPAVDDYVVSTVVVGLSASDGDTTKGNLVSDYEYLTVIDL